MSEHSHKFESLNQTPLLLKYKLRNCHTDWEFNFDANTGEWIGDDQWGNAQTPNYEMWQLQRRRRAGGGSGILTKPNGKIQFFRRHEIHVAGSEEPIMIYFVCYTHPSDTVMKIRSYQLPEIFIEHRYSYWKSICNICVKQVLHEYERCRGGWKPSVLVQCKET